MVGGLPLAAAPKVSTSATVTQKSLALFASGGEQRSPISFSPNGRFLLYRGSSDDASRNFLWDLEQSKNADFCPPDVSLSFSPSSQEPYEDNRFGMWSPDGAILRLGNVAFDLQQGKMLSLQQAFKIDQPKNGFRNFATSIHGNQAEIVEEFHEKVTDNTTVTGTTTRVIYRDFKKGREFVLSKSESTIFNPIFSWDGRRLYGGTVNSSILAWDVVTKHQIAAQTINYDSSLYPVGATRNNRILWLVQAFNSPRGSGNTSYSWRTVAVDAHTLKPLNIPPLKGAMAIGLTIDDVLFCQSQDEGFVVYDGRNGRRLRQVSVGDEEKFMGFVDGGKRAAFWEGLPRGFHFVNTSRN